MVDPTQQFSNLFNSYTKSVNKAYSRTGSLFQKRFGRIQVDTERYFLHLVRYIHQNPQRHGFVEDFRSYPHSSYAALIGTKQTRLQRAVVLNQFGDRANMKAAHARPAKTREAVIDEDFEQRVEN